MAASSATQCSVPQQTTIQAQGQMVTPMFWTHFSPGSSIMWHVFLKTYMDLTKSPTTVWYRQLYCHMQPKTLQYNDFPIEVTATLVSGVGLVMAGMKACDVVLPEKSKRTSRYPPVWVDSAVRLLTEAIEVTTNVERKLGMQLERTWWMSLQREKRRVSSKSYHVVCKTGEET